MVASIGAVKIERCKFSGKMIGGLPHLDMGAMGDSNVFAVRGELDGLDRFFEVEVM